MLYLDPEWLPGSAIGAAADAPTLRGGEVVAAVRAIHESLRHPGDALSAEGGVLGLRELVQPHLIVPTSSVPDVPLARRLRELLDDRLLETFTIAEAAELLGAHRSHLVRVFSQAYGIPPHRYVVGRPVDLARRLLLQGRTAADAAVEAGFHDQSHLTRHFRRTLGTTPGAFAA